MILEKSAMMVDIDGDGIVHFTRYFMWLEEVRERLFNSMNLSLENMHSNGVTVVVASINSTFVLPLKHGDNILISACVSSIGKHSFTVDYVFNKKSGGEVVFKARAVYVFVDKENKKPVLVPAFVKFEKCKSD